MEQQAEPGISSEGRELVDALLTEDLEPLFWQPNLLDRDSAWFAHVPFAHWLMQVHKPRVFVELGTHAGVSYSAFCSVVLRNKFETRCFAVDTWQGDSQSGRYSDKVFDDLRRFNDNNYASFSNLLRTTFDQACEEFAACSIDLLHIDGFHSYEAVKHDFETWLPKLSSRAVVLFHDTNERREGFGVWKFWDEISQNYPSFQWLHNHGLGIILVGGDVSPALKQLCLSSPTDASTLQRRMAFVGARWATQAALIKTKKQKTQADSEAKQATAEASSLRERLDLAVTETGNAKTEVRSLHQRLEVSTVATETALTENQSLRQRFDLATIETDKAMSKIQALLREREHLASNVTALRLQAKDNAQVRQAEIREIEAIRQAHTRVAEAHREIQKKEAEARSKINALADELKSRDKRIAEILRSSSWRVTGPLRRIARGLRRLLKR